MVNQNDNANFFLSRVLTKISNIDIPGFIISNAPADKTKKAKERLVFLPEDFFVRLENSIISKDKDNGKIKLYSLGKQFGFKLAVLLRLARTSAGDIDSSTKYIFRFLETLYAKSLKIIEINLESKLLEIKASDLAITRKNNFGYIISVGGCAGIWAYLQNNYDLECVSKKNSNDGTFELFCGPEEIISSKGNILIAENKPETNDDLDYLKYNSPPLNYQNSGSFSLAKLVENKLLSYESGSLLLSKKSRLLPVEISFLYTLEKELSSVEIFEAAYNCFYDIGTNCNVNDHIVFISQILSGLGFGTINVVTKENQKIIAFSNYPCITKDLKSTNFSLIKGILYGFIDSKNGKKNTYSEITFSQTDSSLNLKIVVN